ncbi:MAG: hypothetical protein NTX80_00610 [Candidatus Saccharibacteria bacterium]|jgi:hypothetical protein|nr:hypothetical protein [Candidatus Saccharibacteria bacterium]
MNTDERFLVILLSLALATFLVLGIVAVIKTIQILDNVRKITEKAEEFAEKAEAVGDFLHKTAGPAVLIKTLGKMARSYTDKK